MAETVKLSIRGKVTEGGTEKSVTISTISGIIATDIPLGSLEETAQWAQGVASTVQAITSATVTGMSLNIVPDINYEDIGEPGDVLDPVEIFSADYSDTAVIPTLNMIGRDDGKTKNYNFKYMADPVNTPNFEKKVAALGSRIERMVNIPIDTANLTFSAKDQVWADE